MFRNDFAFSMAIHIINGCVDTSGFIISIDYLNNSFDLDAVFRVNTSNDIPMFCAKAEKTSEHYY